LSIKNDIASSHKPVKPIEEVLREKHNHDCMVEALVSLQGESTKYTAPQESKAKAHYLFSVHYRLLGLKVPEGYRTALLCAIGHANFHSGRCDAKQSTMARETGFSREYINRALNWWEDHTGFLRIQQRPGHSNAYHVQWKTTDAAWAEIQAKLKRGRCEL
jgi:hypothetical protein